MKYYYTLSYLLCLALIISFSFIKKQDIAPELLNSSVMILTETGSGSGSVFIDNGYCYIWTCSHVVNERKEIFVLDKNERKIAARVIKECKNEDIALLAIEEKWFFKQSIKFNIEKPKVNCVIYHVGCPAGPCGQFSFLEGKTSFPNRIFNKFSYDQIHCPCFYGCSGGGVFNTRGEYIGLVARFLDNNTHGLFLIVPARRIVNFAIRNNVGFAVNF